MEPADKSLLADERESTSEVTVLLEESHIEHVADLRKHARQLLWVIVLALFIVGLFALALLKAADRIQIFYLPSARASAKQVQNSSSPVGRTHERAACATSCEQASCAAAANCSFTSRGVMPAGNAVCVVMVETLAADGGRQV